MAAALHAITNVTPSIFVWGELQAKGITAQTRFCAPERRSVGGYWRGQQAPCLRLCRLRSCTLSTRTRQRTHLRVPAGGWTPSAPAARWRSPPRCCRQSTARAAMRAAATASMSLNSLARTGRCCRRPVRTIRLRNSFRAHSRRAPSGATAASFKTRACPAPQESCPRVRSEPHCWPCGRMSHAAGSPSRRSMPAAARQAAAAAAQ